MDERFAVGQIVTGRITGIQSYGAFVEINSQTQGLIHISEISDRYVRDIRDFVSLGEEIQVKILSVDEKTGKLSLSFKEIRPGKRTTYMPKSVNSIRVQKPSSSGFQVLKKKLDEWIKQSTTKENILK